MWERVLVKVGERFGLSSQGVEDAIADLIFGTLGRHLSDLEAANAPGKAIEPPLAGTSKASEVTDAPSPSSPSSSNFTSAENNNASITVHIKEPEELE